ncbi:MAG: PilN domain-containing protein, partial [Frankiaceae bacterium]
FIEEMTRLLPDNTWVQQFELKTVGKTREVQVTGETSSSSKLIEILEGSTLLRNATPRGTEVRGALPNTVRFQIGAETRPHPQPEARPVVEGAPAAAMPNPPPVPGPAPAAPPKTPGK